MFFLLICWLAAAATMVAGMPISYHHKQIFFLRYRASMLKMPHPSVYDAVPFYFATHSSTCPPRPAAIYLVEVPQLTRGAGNLTAFYPDARKIWSGLDWHLDLFLVTGLCSPWASPSELSFYEGRWASTREEELLQGKTSPTFCRALTTEHCLTLDYCIHHWRNDQTFLLLYYSSRPQREDTL